jgi:hypothetical protein
MKIPHSLFVTITMALTMISVAKAQNSTSTPMPQESTQSTNQPTIKITLDKLRTISDFVVVFQISNPQSSTSIRVPEAEGLLKCRLNIYDGTGKALPYTDRGLKTVGAHTQELGTWVGYDSRYVTIKPSEEKSWNFPLHQFFKLEPGMWYLDLELNIATNAEDSTKAAASRLTIKKFPFEVKPSN